MTDSIPIPEDVLEALRNTADFDDTPPPTIPTRVTDTITRPVVARKAVDLNRPLPHSIEAEQGILGCILIKPDTCDMVARLGFTEEHFHVPAHTLIYTVLREAYEKEKPLDFITLTDALSHRSQLDGVGGASFITHLFTLVPSAANAQYYADILKDKLTLRRIILAAEDAKLRAYDETEVSAQEQLSKAQTVFTEIGEVATVKEPPTMSDLVNDILNRIENDEPEQDIIKTGLKFLDEESPLRQGDYVQVCGEEKAGKTLLAQTITLNTGLDGVRSMFFELEDKTKKVMANLFSNITEIGQHRHSIKHLTESEIASIGRHSVALSRCPITIIDYLFTVSEITATIRQHKRKFPDLKLVVIDQLSLIRGISKKDSKRHEQITEISQYLRVMALQLEVAIIILSQLNKEGDSADSKSLDRDCTAKWQVIKLYEKNPENGMNEEVQDRRLLSIPIQRNGASGINRLVRFQRRISKFSDYIPTPDEPEPSYTTQKSPVQKRYRNDD